MKASELKEMTDDELFSKETELKDQLFKLKFQHALGQLENPMKMKGIRKDLARIMTIRNDKSRGTDE